MELERFTVIGAGNGGCAIAADMTLAGHDVILFEFPEFQSKFDKILDEQAITIKGVAREGKARLYLATTDIEKALNDVELIIVSMPGFGHARLAKEIAPLLKKDQVIIFIPGGLGSFFLLKELKTLNKPNHVIVGETVTLPYAARLSGPNEVSIFITSINNPFAALPAEKTIAIVNDLQKLYGDISPAKDILDVALNNLNPFTHPGPAILSTSRIELADEFWLYREAMTPSVKKVMVAMDRERIAIREGAGYGPPHYGMEKSGANECFEDYFGKGGKEKAGYLLKGPLNMKERYITEDIMNLVLFATLGQKIGVKTPIMNAFIALASVINDTDYIKEGMSLEQLGLKDMSLDEIKHIFRKGM
jgi:opine dehydrogenase